MKDFGFLLLTVALIQNDIYMPNITASKRIFRVFLLQLVFIAALPAIVYSQSPLDNCADQFIEGHITNAPTLFNSFYFLNLIPPVPLALKDGLVAYNIDRVDEGYEITHERTSLLKFWENYSTTHYHAEGNPIYLFTSIFAPTAFSQTIAHRWKWYNPASKSWEITDRINYEITGGRDGGFRGHTYKSGVTEGRWRVEVVTENNRIVGIVNFEVIAVSDQSAASMITTLF